VILAPGGQVVNEVLRQPTSQPSSWFPGDQGSSDELMLRNAGNHFEQGAVDTFAPYLKDLGDLQRVRVRHDDKFPFPGWYLDRIFILNEDSDQDWTFLCNRWLAQDEDDGEIERVLDAA